ncbi:MAG: hypothetical protein ACI9NC_005843, partial [Verrucomicrobiales bacterium]
FLSCLFVCTHLAEADVTINELSGASPERLLKWSDSDQPSLGAGTPWFASGFDDSTWSVGSSPVGFGYPDIATNLASGVQDIAPSFYLRRSFNLSAAQASSGADLLLEAEYDDGFIAFINGVEVARCNLGPAQMFIYADQFAFNADSTHDAPSSFVLGVASDLLVEGENSIAVHVANRNLASAMKFDAGLRIDAGVTLVGVSSDEFDTANGASRTHRNHAAGITNTTSGTSITGGWLQLSPNVRSDPAWSDLEITTLSDATAGETGDGAISYTLTGTSPTHPAAISFPPVDLSAHWNAAAVTAADLSETRLTFRFKGDPNMAFDLAIEPDDGSGAITAGGFPPVLASNDSTLGYWRFDEAGANVGSVVSNAVDNSGNGLDATPVSSGGGTYSTDVPGAQIFDPLANASRTNTFSMDVSDSNRRLGISNSPILNTSFTMEMFIKIDGEPVGYNAFIRRNLSNTSRWQIDFDHANSGAFGRLRSRFDTPDGDNTNFVVGPTGGGGVPATDRIWVDTDSGNGQVSGYNDPGDWANDGDGINDTPGWHHVAITLDESTGEVKLYYDYELKQSRTLVDIDNSGYAHPTTGIQFGKFGAAYDMLIDEVRYSAGALGPDEFLQVVSSPAAVWTTYTTDLGSGDAAQRTALLNHINANNQTGFTPVLQVRDESYSAGGKKFVLDSFQVDYARGGAVSQIFNPGATWRHTAGAIEPSGGVFEPAFIGQVPGAKFVDWIELHNDGLSVVDLEGWTLSDELSQPAKWKFPAGANISAGGYLLILADDQDISGIATDFLHTNFKLSAGGEFLGLFNPAGVVQSQFFPEFPRQLDFHSLGKNPAGTDFGYLETPSPGKTNTGQFFTGEVAKPDFNVPGGFHSAALTLSISTTTPSATIRYTTDGTEPTETNGAVYMGALTLAPINTRTAHTIRARAYATGLVPSRTKSSSYLIAQSNNIRQAPALMITADAGRSIEKPFGVLAIDGGQYVGAIWEPIDHGDYNMLMERGRPVERPIFLEYYFADSTEGFREDAGMRASGSNHLRPRAILVDLDASPWQNNSREKLSFNIYFRDEYEDSSVTLPLFGPDYPVDTFEQLRPRAGKNDISNPFIKDEIMRRLYLDMEQVGSRGVFNSLYVNGEWKGYYNTCERLREPFFQQHYSGGEWDIRQAGNPNGGLAQGTNDAWNELNTRLQAANVNSKTAWESALELVDPIAMADYFLLNIYGATWDWPGNNWVSARQRSAAGRYRYYVWDAEGAFGHPRRNGTTNSNKPVDHNTIQDDLLSGGNSTSRMFQRLERWPEFKLILADRIQRHFFNGGTLDDSLPASSRAKQLIDGAVSEFAPLNTERNNVSADTEFWNYWTTPGASRRSYLFGPNQTQFSTAGYWPVTRP